MEVKVRATEDIFSPSSNRLIAKDGEIGLIPHYEVDEVDKRGWIKVRWRNNKTRTDSPTWKLELIKIDMKNKLTVVMLPTEKASRLHLKLNDNFLLKSTQDIIFDNYTPQHLYLVSDEEIKEGNWIIGDEGLVLVDKEVLKNLKESPKFFNHIRKIIATTEHLQSKTLSEDFKNISSPHVVPLIPESFIKDYVKSNGEIINVEVETENPFPEAMGNVIFPSVIKTTENNEVIILNK